MSSSFQKETFEKVDVKNRKERSDIVIENIIQGFVKKSSVHQFKMLDVGCGGGQLLENFCRKDNIEVHGIDISQEALRVSKNKGYCSVECDLEADNMPYPDSFFDVVVMNDLIEHIINPDRMLREARRVIKPEGSIIVCTPNVSHPVSWAMQIVLDLPPMQSARYKSVHVRDFTLRILNKTLELNGLSVSKAQGTFIYPIENRISYYIATRIPRLSERLIVISKKGENPKNEVKDIYFDVQELLKAG
ncbi:MAG TPA: class I SAM-dependent methyltransferase [Methanomassiliicoccales archaeon]|jgi:methionine biosynthesis protein MetW